MKTYKNLYQEIYNLNNLILAWRKARKGKTKKDYVIEFEKDLIKNLLDLHNELKNQTYKPLLLRTFILRDPKTRKISESDFRDRIVHHALIRILEPIFEKRFIYDSCANQKNKGNLFALKRFYYFMGKVSRNGKTNGWFNVNQIRGYCLKADIKHYFEEVDHEILINIIKRRVRDEKVMGLIEKILKNSSALRGGGVAPEGSTSRYFFSRKNIGAKQFFSKKGMPLGNLTSQFFANVYLNELDYFVKHKLRAKYYIRYVDDFVILHKSKEQLEYWKNKIGNFLVEKLRLELHLDKSRVIQLSRGIDFVGFRNFYYFRLLRIRNIGKMLFKIKRYKKEEITKEKLLESFQGWNAYVKWADTLKLRRKIVSRIYS
ncbi:hypothetical protein HYT23_02675 [Candidatus Pacearchaeota archaeon]|nr:hypothetical protein [Candidatus Pacearchaeota archaeon]